MDRVNERSTAYLSVSFRDKAGALAAPTAISYRVDDVESGQEIRGDTAVAPAASSIEITLTPSDNTLINALRQGEQHVVTVDASYGDDDAVRAQYVYEVVNLQKVA